MKTIRILQWHLLVDVEATAQAHQNRSQGGPEDCGCVECRNFVAARDQVYPAQFLDWLSRLGIPPDRETEIFHLGVLDDGTHRYGGWFHFLGTVTEKPLLHSLMDDRELDRARSLDPGFELHISDNGGLLPKNFPRGAIGRLEFRVDVPWLLEADPPQRVQVDLKPALSDLVAPKPVAPKASDSKKRKRQDPLKQFLPTKLYANILEAESLLQEDEEDDSLRRLLPPSLYEKLAKTEAARLKEEEEEDDPLQRILPSYLFDK